MVTTSILRSLSVFLYVELTREKSQEVNKLEPARGSQQDHDARPETK